MQANLLGNTLTEKSFKEKIPKVPKISPYNRSQKLRGTIIGVSLIT